MINFLFVGLTACLSFVLFNWAFRHLPGERWHILASIPLRKNVDDTWTGVNLTYYGFITAVATAVAAMLFVLLAAAVGASPLTVCVAVVAVMAVALPAASWTARLVEGKKHTFTVAGAAFVGMICAPPIVWFVCRRLEGEQGVLLLWPILAAMSIAYIVGEGLGRLACISFGCCYGKPLDQCGLFARRLFEKFNFTFQGSLKKITYASSLQGVKVLPIQAVTAVLYTIVGLLGVYLYLESRFAVAFAVTGGFAQLWRVYSETLRADYRGEGRISVYQVLSFIAAVYAVTLPFYFPVQGSVKATLLTGLIMMCRPGMILFFMSLWLLIFWRMGTSMVTGSVLSFHVHKDRI